LTSDEKYAALSPPFSKYLFFITNPSASLFYIGTSRKSGYGNLSFYNLPLSLSSSFYLFGMKTYLNKFSLSKVPSNSFKSIAWFGLNYSTSGFKV
jgi:hypothetical protein